MKKNNINLNSKNNFTINRVMYIITFFVFLINSIYSQINQIDTKCLWISRESMINEKTIESALLFAHESGFDKVFLQIRGRGDAFYNSTIVPQNNSIVTTFGDNYKNC